MPDLRFRSLASSSAGNAYLVEDAGGRLLLECGVPFRRLEKLAGFELSGLCGCLITHEHKDHSYCWLELVRRGVRVFASGGTREALEGELLEELPGDGAGGYAPFALGGFDVLPFRTFHDAREPVGYLIRSQRDGDKLAFATDTVNLRYRFPGVNLLAVEANYGADVLARQDRMPEKVKKRVANSHMEIGRLCGYLGGLDLSACREIYLLHLSDASSREAEFVRRVRQVVPRHAAVTACPK